jgi:hypothetical protein
MIFCEEYWRYTPPPLPFPEEAVHALIVTVDRDTCTLLLVLLPTNLKQPPWLFAKFLFPKPLIQRLLRERRNVEVARELSATTDKNLVDDMSPCMMLIYPSLVACPRIEIDTDDKSLGNSAWSALRVNIPNFGGIGLAVKLVDIFNG